MSRFLQLSLFLPTESAKRMTMFNNFPFPSLAAYLFCRSRQNLVFRVTVGNRCIPFYCKNSNIPILSLVWLSVIRVQKQQYYRISISVHTRIRSRPSCSSFSTQHTVSVPLRIPASHPRATDYSRTSASRNKVRMTEKSSRSFSYYGCQECSIAGYNKFRGFGCVVRGGSDRAFMHHACMLCSVCS